MPELIEVEVYRQHAEAVVGRTIVDVPRIDELGLRGEDPHDVAEDMIGATVTGTNRRGKLLMLLTDGPVIGLRFGMTGRLIVDGDAHIDALIYGGKGNKDVWDRYVIAFDHGDLRIRDPRRLGGLELDPDVSRLGPDAATISGEQLDVVIGSSTARLKSRLMDQYRLAGLGNLLVDEILWRIGLDPAREARSLDTAQRHALADEIVATVADMTERGGSHTGDLQEFRFDGALCPRDGTPLARRSIGGRTTYSCPRHQL